MDARFTAQVAAVSAGLALAAATLIEGDGWPLLVVGLILGVASLVGLLVLARTVVLDRRHGSRR